VILHKSTVHTIGDGVSDIDPPARPESAFTGWELLEARILYREPGEDPQLVAVWKCEVQS
jgi:hypothetical protein